MKDDIFNLAHYDFDLPRQLIAQEPARPRDSSRLLVLERSKKTISEKVFSQISDFFSPGDVLVLNNTQVIKARLVAEKRQGGKVEILLLKEIAENTWETLVKPGKRARVGDQLIFSPGGLEAEIMAKTEQGGRWIRFSSPDSKKTLEEIGQMPLPPYIKQKLARDSDYQTVYATKPGAVAAPTAGLHFSKRLLNALNEKGVEIVKITLHCGLATFRPLKCGDIRKHKIDSEWMEVSQQAAHAVNSAKQLGRKIFTVGTTVARSLEAAAVPHQNGQFRIKPFCGETNLYIVPGYKFKMTDGLVTNFHTPCSTNLILVASFCGLGLLKESYAFALQANFRFFSFGDAMLII